jgi:hypothetical protein
MYPIRLSKASPHCAVIAPVRSLDMAVSSTSSAVSTRSASSPLWATTTPHALPFLESTELQVFAIASCSVRLLGSQSWEYGIIHSFFKNLTLNNINKKRTPHKERLEPAVRAAKEEAEYVSSGLFSGPPDGSFGTPDGSFGMPDASFGTPDNPFGTPDN